MLLVLAKQVILEMGVGEWSPYWNRDRFIHHTMPNVNLPAFRRSSRVTVPGHLHEQENLPVRRLRNGQHHPATMPVASEEKALRRLMKASGVDVLAAGPGQYPTGFKSLGHGVFTLSLS